MAAKKERTSREPRPTEVCRRRRRAEAPFEQEDARRHGSLRAYLPSLSSEKAVGVPVGLLRQIAKTLGRSHELAEALWRTGHYEARMLATFVAELAPVTALPMERWCRDVDGWAICDTARFALFNRAPHAFGKRSELKSASVQRRLTARIQKA